jgi:hypothetical protein
MESVSTVVKAASVQLWMFIYTTYPEHEDASNGVWSVSEDWVKKEPHEKDPVNDPKLR